MKRSFQSLLALSLVTSIGACALDDGTSSSALGDRDPDPSELKGDPSILTQNQYLGADFTPVFRQVTSAGFDTELDLALLNIEATDWLTRVLALSLEIVFTQPDVVALQEVGDFTLNGLHDAGDLYRDRLADTLVTLLFLGSVYVPVAQVQNWKITTPIDRNNDMIHEGLLNITDRNVTLARLGVTAAPVSYGLDCPLAPPVAGPGCSYSTYYTAINPTAIIPVLRGFVAIDATIDGEVYRIVNTQLETRDIDLQNPFSPAIQSSQATELLETLEIPAAGVDVKLPVGDFQSDPEDEEVVVGPFTIVPPYLQLVEDYVDTWLENQLTEPGDTCCQLPSLANLLSALDRRVDFIFSSVEPDEVEALVAGDSVLERLLFGIWPARHGAVFADLTY